jgi:XTP/dITP diphosphohydrolase
MRKLLLATRNSGKAQELFELFSHIPFELTTLDREEVLLEVQETGETFEQNAVLKAESYASAACLLTLADDSGLEVEALGWEPGIFSARYAGEKVSDAERVQYLLGKLKDVPAANRFARFRCVVALADDKGLVKTFEGICEGQISLYPRGENGFGYDPVFYLPEDGKTMAEISAQRKNVLSHRSQAAYKAVQWLMESNLDGIRGMKNASR